MNKSKQNARTGFGAGSAPPDGAAFKSAGSFVKYSVEEMLDSVIATAMRIPDPVAASEHLRLLTSSAFGAKYGAEIGRLEEEIRQVEEEYMAEKSELDDLRQQLLDTPEWIAASRDNQNRNAEDHVETPFWRWQLRHQVGAIVLTLLLGGALTASAVTAHYNIIGTGLPVFIDNPILA